VFLDFVRGGRGLAGRPDDLIGIVSFAAYADTRCPLTLDHDNLVRVAHGLELVKNPAEDGTAIGDGLGLALERLERAPVKAGSRVAILLTDGVNNRGETAPLQAAELARKLGVKVFTIGAGTTGMAPVRVESPFGGTLLQRVPVEIDEEVLREIARRTGGRYYRATDAEALRRVYQDIDALTRSEIIEERFQKYHEYYRHAAAAGLLMLAAAFLLSGTVLRRMP
jgi:Ca-activated chloride channel family protein